MLLEWRTADDGEAELAVESLPAMWSYAFYYDLMPLAQRSGEYWVKVQIIVDQGNVAVGVLNRDKSDFLSQVTYNGAGPRVQDVYAHIREIGEASQIVFRNLTPDGQPARFPLRGVGLLREDTAADDAATAGGQEVEAKRAAGLTFASSGGMTRCAHRSGSRWRSWGRRQNPRRHLNLEWRGLPRSGRPLRVSSCVYCAAGQIGQPTQARSVR